MAFAADPARRAAHLRWDLFADRYLARQPLAPTCRFDANPSDDIDASVGAVRSGTSAGRRWTSRSAARPAGWP